MTDRQLKLEEELPYLGPAVLEWGDGTLLVVQAVRLGVDEEDRPALYLQYVDQFHVFPLESEDDVTVDEKSGKITFNSSGEKYVIRAMQDSDGVQLSTLGISVPAEALETLFMREVAMVFNPESIDTSAGESLIALADEAAGEVQELVYTSDAGMFVRNNGGWFRVPPEHDEFDGLVILEVGPSFVETFDKAEKAGRALFRSDAEKEPTETEKARTAAAGWAKTEEDDLA